jgi:hypothetical protein
LIRALDCGPWANLLDTLTNALGNDDPEAKLGLHLTLSIAARDEVKRLLGKFDGLTR